MNQILQRPKGLYEQLVNSLANSALTSKDESVSSVFLNESGKINLDIVKEKVDVMYRFLETVNSAKIKTINESYISDLLSSIV